jgi:glutamate dehydrogenase (NAD(P)+)
VTALAAGMTWKSSLAHIPFGGGKGGIIVDPNRLSRRELEALTRRYVAEIVDAIGPEKDVPAPDVNTNDQIMAWIMDTYSMHVGHTATAVVTGKPIEMGGSLGRREATGRGVMIVTRESAKHLGLEIKGAKVAVQGFGNVGSVSADLLAKIGAKIVAVTDWKGGVYNDKGLDVTKMIDYARQHKSIEGFPGGEPLENDKLFSLDVDVLIPAALENQITMENAPKIRAKIIAEGANGPTTPDAHKYLHEHGVFVIPDILANSGGVTTSYFEWVQDRYGYFWEEDEVNQRLEKKMCEAFGDVLATSLRYKTDMRTAAYIVAINRVATVTKMRGMYA